MRLPPRLRTGLAGIALMAFLATGSPARATDERPFDVRTAYLAEPLLGAHLVRIEGLVAEGGGKALLELDPNRCQLGEFGDVTICTRMAARRLEVGLARVKMADPSGMGRHLFAVSGLPEEPATSPGPRLFLVVPPQGSGDAWRLVADGGDAGRRVVTLETHPPAPASSPPPPPAPPSACRGVAYAATQRGGQLTLVAELDLPTPGYTLRFERLRVRGDGVWFRLVCEPPSGLVPQVITGGRASTTIELGRPLAFVTVADDDGSHRVEVAHD